MTTEDLYDDPSYRAWMDECARGCRCCDQCAQTVCAGVTAGGMCDELCWCGDPDEDEWPPDGECEEGDL